MHQTIINYCEKVKAKFPDHFENVCHIDFGSLDVNGHNDYLFDFLAGFGVDIAEGPNVHIVCRCHEMTLKKIKEYGISICPEKSKALKALPEEKFMPDTIISTQMLEHDIHWKLSIQNMYDLLRPGGLLLLTWAAPGFGKHSAYEGKYPDLDHYYELSEADFRGVLDCDELFSEYEFELNKIQKDLCFWGIKK